MHSDLFRLSRMLRERGIRTTVLSSGLLLGRYAASLAADIDDIIVSLDGPAAIHDAIRGVPRAFELLAEGARAIHRISPEYPIAARCTVQSRNVGHLRTTVATARELSLRSISFLAADLTSAAFHRPVPWTEEKRADVSPALAQLGAEIEALIAEDAGDGFVLESPAKLRRIVAHFRGDHVAPRCNAPWVSAVVEANGDVRPCFFHAAIGNTAEGTLSEVLNSPRAIAFREGLSVGENPVCRQCVCSLYVAP
jgi:MoaA/NifB/PqqE/SkfB family radical SAM enzyme